MSVKEQCELIAVPRSSYYHRSERNERLEDEVLMQVIDRIYMQEPTYGTRRMMDELNKLGHKVGRDRTRRLMREMGIQAIYPKPRLSDPGKGHKIYPYLLRNLEIDHVDQVWCTDITYIPLGNTHVYLVAVMDWYSRRIISWRLSNTVDTSFCVEALKEAIELEGAPGIFNTDQGSQFTSIEFTEVLRAKGIKISMDGKGRALDNRMIERFWRTVKYDDIYIRAYENMPELYRGLKSFINKYNHRKHQTLGISPMQKYLQNKIIETAA